MNFLERKALKTLHDQVKSHLEPGEEIVELEAGQAHSLKRVQGSFVWSDGRHVNMAASPRALYLILHRTVVDTAHFEFRRVDANPPVVRIAFNDVADITFDSRGFAMKLPSYESPGLRVNFGSSRRAGFVGLLQSQVDAFIDFEKHYFFRDTRSYASFIHRSLSFGSYWESHPHLDPVVSGSRELTSSFQAWASEEASTEAEKDYEEGARGRDPHPQLRARSSPIPVNPADVGKRRYMVHSYDVWQEVLLNAQTGSKMRIRADNFNTEEEALDLVRRLREASPNYEAGIEDHPFMYRAN